MKKAIVCLAVLATATSVFAIPAAGWLVGGDGTGKYTGSFDYTWDFGDGTQGWNLTGANGGGATWVSTFGTGTTSGTGAIKLTGGQAAPVTQVAQAMLDATTLPMPAGMGSGNIGGLFGGNTSSSINYHNVRWVMEATVWYEGGLGALSGVGIAVPRTGDMKGPYIAGRPAGNRGMVSDDKSWSPNSAKNRSGGTTLGTVGDNGFWVTMQIDYGYTNPGQWTSGYTATAGNTSGWADGSWHTGVTWDHHAETHPADINKMLLLGNGVQGMLDIWTASYFDTVKLAVLPAPEPSTVTLLALGAFRPAPPSPVVEAS